MEEYDVLDSGFVANETYLRAKAPELRQFLSYSQALKAAALDRVYGAIGGATIGGIAAGPTGALVGGAIGGTIGARHYFRTLPAMREAIPRAAMFRYQMGRLERGRELRPGVSDITGLEGVRAAAKIAREFTVDYGKFTPFENRMLRGLLFPFYSFVRQNTPNWLRYMAYAPLGASAFLALRLLLEMWNNDDDERRKVEQSLPPYKRNSAHIVTGWRDEQGKMIVVYWAGDPMADALGMVGLAGTPSRLSDLATGRITLDRAVRQQLEAFVKEPGQRVSGLLNPAAKLLVELPTGKESFGFGRDIVPRELQGTAEAFKRQARHVAETAFRPLREERKLREQAGKQEGVDLLTHRFGLGLPFERVDPKKAADDVAMAKWSEGRAEYVQQAIDRLRARASFQNLAPHQQELALRQEAARAARDWNSITKGAPVPTQRRLMRRFTE
jgi:hypothetical protein